MVVAMEKDVADKVEELTLQPLAEALRQRLGSDAVVAVYNQPIMTNNGKIDYATWITCCHNGHRTEVVLRLLRPYTKEVYGFFAWGKGGRFVLPVPPGDGEGRGADNVIGQSPFLAQAADRINATWAEWEHGPPDFLDG